METREYRNYTKRIHYTATKFLEPASTMKPLVAFSVVALATLSNALIRFQCSQLVIERLDPS
ncbi:hypothetical protein PG997_012582 [Apiospora hydei]|uniref:Uncharacterized protein n=1 Tax=Apiospora hydei TaxID=1337664 RepID=A0ABR1V3S3_9PEZI